MANNVISQVKIGSSTYDIKDNHMIFRDIYYRGTASEKHSSHSVYTIDVHRQTTTANWVGRIWIQMSNTVNTSSFYYFPNHDTWSNYKEKNIYLGMKFLQITDGYSISNFGPNHITVEGNRDESIECIQLFLEQGTIHTFNNLAFNGTINRAALKDDMGDGGGTPYRLNS